MALTKATIVDRMCDELDLTKSKSTEVVESLLETIKSDLESGDGVLVSGFEKFCMKDKRARRGRNPANGEGALLRARRVVTFKCSGKLRERLNRDD